MGGVLFGKNKVVLVFDPGVHAGIPGAGRVGEKLSEEDRQENYPVCWTRTSAAVVNTDSAIGHRSARNTDYIRSGSH